MSIFSKLFDKKKNEEQWAKRHADIDHEVSEERYGPRTVDEERSSLSNVDIKIPWGMPRSKMTAEQLNAIREYDRVWYANHRSKEAKEKERGWVVDPTCCAEA